MSNHEFLSGEIPISVSAFPSINTTNASDRSQHAIWDSISDREKDRRRNELNRRKKGIKQKTFKTNIHGGDNLRTTTILSDSQLYFLQSASWLRKQKGKKLVKRKVALSKSKRIYGNEY